jgi:hypothetical protein
MVMLNAPHCDSEGLRHAHRDDRLKSSSVAMLELF